VLVYVLVYMHARESVCLHAPAGKPGMRTHTHVQTHILTHIPTYNTHTY